MMALAILAGFVTSMAELVARAIELVLQLLRMLELRKEATERKKSGDTR